MGEEMTAACTVVKTGPRMEKAKSKLHELQARFEKVRLADGGMWTNQNLSFTRALGDMLTLGEAILQGSINREESRGSHYRPDFLERNDERFHQTTVAEFNPDTGRPDLSYKDVIGGMVKLRPRDYGRTESEPKSESKDETAKV